MHLPFTEIHHLLSFTRCTPDQIPTVWECTQGIRFGFLASSYYEFLTDEKTNSMFYDYWVEQVRARISNPEKKDMVAPLKQQIPIATKLPSLEQDYYEMIDRPNITLHNPKQSPIVEFDATGVVTGDGKDTQHHELDIVIFATGYDAVTGSLLDLAITDKNEQPLEEKWRDGVLTHLGLMVPGCPNLFMSMDRRPRLLWLMDRR